MEFHFCGFWRVFFYPDRRADPDILTAVTADATEPGVLLSHASSERYSPMKWEPPTPTRAPDNQFRQL